MFLTETWRGPSLSVNRDTPALRLGDRGAAAEPPELLSSCLGGDRKGREGTEQRVWERRASAARAWRTEEAGTHRVLPLLKIERFLLYIWDKNLL